MKLILAVGLVFAVSFAASLPAASRGTTPVFPPKLPSSGNSGRSAPLRSRATDIFYREESSSEERTVVSHFSIASPPRAIRTNKIEAKAFKRPFVKPIKKSSKRGNAGINHFSIASGTNVISRKSSPRNVFRFSTHSDEESSEEKDSISHFRIGSQSRTVSRDKVGRRGSSVVSRTSFSRDDESSEEDRVVRHFSITTSSKPDTRKIFGSKSSIRSTIEKPRKVNQRSYGNKKSSSGVGFPPALPTRQKSVTFQRRTYPTKTAKIFSYAPPKPVTKIPRAYSYVSSEETQRSAALEAETLTTLHFPGYSDEKNEKQSEKIRYHKASSESDEDEFITDRTYDLNTDIIDNSVLKDENHSSETSEFDLNISEVGADEGITNDQANEDIPENEREDIPENEAEDIHENDKEDINENDKEDIPENEAEDIPENEKEDIPENEREIIPDNEEEFISQDEAEDIPDNETDYIIPEDEAVDIIPTERTDAISKGETGENIPTEETEVIPDDQAVEEIIINEDIPKNDALEDIYLYENKADININEGQEIVFDTQAEYNPEVEIEEIPEQEAIEEFLVIDQSELDIPEPRSENEDSSSDKDIVNTAAVTKNIETKEYEEATEIEESVTGDDEVLIQFLEPEKSETISATEIEIYDEVVDNDTLAEPSDSLDEAKDGTVNSETEEESSDVQTVNISTLNKISEEILDTQQKFDQSMNLRELIEGFRTNKPIGVLERENEFVFILLPTTEQKQVLTSVNNEQASQFGVPLSDTY